MKVLNRNSKTYLSLFFFLSIVFFAFSSFFSVIAGSQQELIVKFLILENQINSSQLQINNFIDSISVVDKPKFIEFKSFIDKENSEIFEILKINKQLSETILTKSFNLENRATLTEKYYRSILNTNSFYGEWLDEANGNNVNPSRIELINQKIKNLQKQDNNIYQEYKSLPDYPHQWELIINNIWSSIIWLILFGVYLFLIFQSIKISLRSIKSVKILISISFVIITLLNIFGFIMFLVNGLRF